MTLMIELPDETAERARIAAAARGLDMNAFAVAALTDAVETEQEDFPPLSDSQVIAAIQEGIVDADAGRFVTLEAWRASIEVEDATSRSSLATA